MEVAIEKVVKRRNFSLTPYLYLLPMLVGTVIFTIIPAAYNIYISFTNYSLFHYKEFEVIGLGNYREIFTTGSAFLPVITWTTIWALVCTFLNITVGLILALLLNNPYLKERNIYRTLLIIPWALPFIITVQMWAGLLNIDGAFNQLLHLFGIRSIRWLTTPFWARVSVIAVNLWLSYPFFMTVSLAALQSIPQEVYEASELDGATGWTRFRYITFPLLQIAITPLAITQISFQFNNFGVIYLLTSGNPLAYPGSDYGVTDILVTYTYKLMRNAQRYGLTAAYGVVIFFIIATFTYINSRVSNAFREE